MNFFFSSFNKVMGIYISLLISSVILGGSVYAQEMMIGFGDSITAGYPYIDGLDGNGRRVGGYEPYLENLMSNAGKPSIVLNYGVGGETTPEGVNRIESVLSSRTSDYILIMEGTNDKYFGISAQATAFNIGVMIDKCRAGKTTPIVGNLTPASRDENGDIPHEINPAIESVVSKKNAHFVDHYTATVDNWENLEYDSVHPNREGYEAIAKNWFDKIITISNSRSSGGWLYLLLD